MAERKQITVERSPDAVVELLEDELGGRRRWTVERSEDGLLIFPSDPMDYQLEPKLGTFETFPYPEPLAVQVDIEPGPGGGASVDAQLIRHRAGHLARRILWQSLHPISAGNGGVLAHAARRIQWRERRRRGRLQMLRLVIDPLVPHERGDDTDPFRGGRR